MINPLDKSILISNDRFQILIYENKLRDIWNQFLNQSKNGTFLFNRNYMDYHSDRFEDYSLMIYKKNKLIALLPGNIKDDIYYSHQGLTYGGLIMSSKVILEDVIEIFQLLIIAFKSLNIKKVIYKPTPYIYHRQPSQEDIYALFKVCKAKKIGCNISSTINQKDKIKFIESRRSGIRKAFSNNVKILLSDDYTIFWKILENNLRNKYGVSPVHSLKEIELLHDRFPENIKLYLGFKEGEPLGGTLIYIMHNLIHTQYISASPLGKELGVLDYLFDKLINEIYLKYEWFDFGQSTEQMGNLLNESLLFQKEGFGGRGVCYDIFEFEI